MVSNNRRWWAWYICDIYVSLCLQILAGSFFSLKLKQQTYNSLLLNWKQNAWKLYTWQCSPISTIEGMVCGLSWCQALKKRNYQKEADVQFSSVQSLSCVWLFAVPWTAPRQASLSITNCRSLPKPMSIESVIPSNHHILCHPLLLLPSIFPSIRVFSNESALCIRWPKYCSFSFHLSPSNKHPGLVSFRMDWLDLLAVQGTLKSLLQHHSSKASTLLRSAFFIVQLSHPYVTIGKTIALTRRTFVGKVMSLCNAK